MAKSRFKITEFLNRTGSKAYRVSGTLDGKTIRKNFKTRAEASDYRQKRDIEFLNGESTGQTVWTTLTHGQNRDAIAAVAMLRKAFPGKSLSFAVDYFVRNYRHSSEGVTQQRRGSSEGVRLRLRTSKPVGLLMPSFSIGYSPTPRPTRQFPASAPPFAIGRPKGSEAEGVMS